MSSLQNKIDFTKGDFSLVKQHVNMMSKEIEKYKAQLKKEQQFNKKVELNKKLRELGKKKEDIKSNG